MARVHLFLVLHLLDGFVIDFVLGLVRQRGFAGVLQQRFHQQPIVVEGEPVLDLGPLVQLLLLRRLRQHDHVDEIVDEVVALLFGRDGRHVAADLLLGEGDVALADIDAVDAGDDGVVILRPGYAARNADRRGQEYDTNQHAKRAADG